MVNTIDHNFSLYWFESHFQKFSLSSNMGFRSACWGIRVPGLRARYPPVWSIGQGGRRQAGERTRDFGHTDLLSGVPGRPTGQGVRLCAQIPRFIDRTLYKGGLGQDGRNLASKALETAFSTPATFAVN